MSWLSFSDAMPSTQTQHTEMKTSNAQSFNILLIYIISSLIPFSLLYVLLLKLCCELSSPLDGTVNSNICDGDKSVAFNYSGYFFVEIVMRLGSLLKPGVEFTRQGFVWGPQPGGLLIAINLQSCLHIIAINHNFI